MKMIVLVLALVALVAGQQNVTKLVPNPTLRARAVMWSCDLGSSYNMGTTWFLQSGNGPVYIDIESLRLSPGMYVIAAQKGSGFVPLFYAAAFPSHFYVIRRSTFRFSLMPNRLNSIPDGRVSIFDYSKFDVQPTFHAESNCIRGLLELVSRADLFFDLKVKDRSAGTLILTSSIRTNGVLITGTLKNLDPGEYYITIRDKMENTTNCHSLGPSIAFTSGVQLFGVTIDEPATINFFIPQVTLIPNFPNSIVNRHLVLARIAVLGENSRLRRKNLQIACGLIEF